MNYTITEVLIYKTLQNNNEMFSGFYYVVDKATQLRYDTFTQEELKGGKFFLKKYCHMPISLYSRRWNGGIPTAPSLWFATSPTLGRWSRPIEEGVYDCPFVSHEPLRVTIGI